jgi:cyclopropane-fatty-acyl-phospholipid synthase
MPDNRYEAYAKGENFISKYIFPGGDLPTVTQLVDSIHNGSGGELVVDAIENIGTPLCEDSEDMEGEFHGSF